MKRSFVGVLACMTVVGLSVTAGAQAEAPVQPDYKVVTGSSGDLVSDDAFDLQSVVSGSSLTYKRQGTLGGINLGWDTKHGDYVTIKRQAGSGPVKYGEPVAIRVRRGNDGNYIRYSRRDLGINLDWSSSPVYEWRIKGGQDGQPVKAGAVIAIVSTVEKDSLVYCYRKNGAWLKWSKDCSRAERELAKRGAPSL
ncbi:MAG: hypothetical protein IPK71_11665 [Myxococcales bacterium]|jgi:hypothetical protein|nr:hypothetical protein [Myxococcales bacterium]